jgi:hypothetical protein
MMNIFHRFKIISSMVLVSVPIVHKIVMVASALKMISLVIL